jgi:hypothetical protein
MEAIPNYTILNLFVISEEVYINEFEGGVLGFAQVAVDAMAKAGQGIVVHSLAEGVGISQLRLKSGRSIALPLFFLAP